jgi:hypothetical protein
MMSLRVLLHYASAPITLQVIFNLKRKTFLFHHRLVRQTSQLNVLKDALWVCAIEILKNT